MNRTLIIALLAAACGGGSEPVTAVTWNAGLAEGFVDGAASRVAPVAAALDAIDADVVCLQEVWAPEEIAALQAGSPSFPHQLWPEGGQISGDGPGCTTEELDKVLGCLDESCANICPEYTDDCLLNKCAIKFINVSPDCQGCFMANVGGDSAAVRDACSTGYPQYAYDGAFGTALLSKHPIVSSEHHDLGGTTNRRGVHHAVIKGPAGKMDVYCTHFTAVFSLLPYPRESGDWDVEQRAMADDLISYVKSSAETDQVLVLGDFNTGPAIGEAVFAEQPATYDKFIADGYANPYAELDGSCTWCGDNPLIGNDDSLVLDHVFVKGFEGEASAERILDESLEIEVCDEAAPGALSDHYAIKVTVAP